MQKCIFKASAGYFPLFFREVQSVRFLRSWLRAGNGTPALLLGCPLSCEPGQPLSCLVLAAPWAFWALFGERAGLHFQDLCPAGWLQVLATQRHCKGRAQTCSRLSPFLLQNVWQPWSHRMLWSCPDKIHLKITDFFIKVRSITDPTLSPSLPPWLLASNYSRRKWDKGRIWLVNDCTGTWKKSSHPRLFVLIFSSPDDVFFLCSKAFTLQRSWTSQMMPQHWVPSHASIYSLSSGPELAKSYCRGFYHQPIAHE